MENKKYLVLKGCAGLGNRLITLMGAIRYCERTQRILYVDWADGMFAQEGQNAFTQYFELNGGVRDRWAIDNALQNGGSTYPQCIKLSDWHQPIYHSYSVYTSPIARKTPYKMLMSLFCKGRMSYFAGLQSWWRKEYFPTSHIDVIKRYGKGDNFPIGSLLSYKRNEDVVFYADFRPLVGIKLIFNYLTLKKDIADEINKYADTHGIREAIGIHIRYTDKKPNKKLSRLKLKIDELIARNPRQKIFLCTDNNDIIDDFRKLYGENIIMREKFIPQTKKGGIHHWALNNNDNALKVKMMRDSIMDMWLLGMTKQLYWQGNSSFSYISKIIKNNPSHTYNWMKI